MAKKRILSESVDEFVTRELRELSGPRDYTDLEFNGSRFRIYGGDSLGTAMEGYRKGFWRAAEPTAVGLEKAPGAARAGGLTREYLVQADPDEIVNRTRGRTLDAREWFAFRDAKEVLDDELESMTGARALSDQAGRVRRRLNAIQEALLKVPTRDENPWTNAAVSVRLVANKYQVIASVKGAVRVLGVFTDEGLALQFRDQCARLRDISAQEARRFVPGTTIELKPVTVAAIATVPRRKFRV